MTPSALPPAVALVPGFFGFDHHGETTYFADRFVAGLRSVLEARGLAGVPVLSVSTLVSPAPFAVILSLCPNGYNARKHNEG